MSLSSWLSDRGKQKGLKTLAKLQNKKVQDAKGDGTIVVPGEYADYTSEELLRFSLAVRPEYKGLYACAYAEYGGGVGMSTTVDLFKPFAPIFTFSLTLGGNVTVLQETVLMIHRIFPKQIQLRRRQASTTTVPPQPLPEGNPTQQPIDALASASRKKAGSVTKPMCFMAFAGTKVDVSGKIAVALGADVNNLFGLENSIIDVGVSASVQYEFKGEFFVLRDKYPGWYTGIADDTLENDYQQILLPGYNSLYKKQAVKWLKEHVYYSVLNSDLESDDDTKKLIKLIRALPDRRKSYLPYPFTNASSTEISKKLNEILLVLGQVIPNQLGRVITEKEKTELITRLKSFQQMIKQANAAKAELKRTHELAQKKSRLDYGLNKARFEKLAFVSMQIITPGIVTLSLKAGVFPLGSLINPPDGSLDPKPVSGSISVDGQAQYAYSRTDSRYQAFTLRGGSSMPMVFTQDVKIRYHRARILSLRISGNIDFYVGHRLSGDVTKDHPDIAFNSMNYRAVSAYWRLPNDSKTHPNVELQTGSGVSFGGSYNTYTIIGLAKKLFGKSNAPTSPTTPAGEDTQVLKLGENLRMTPEQVKGFLKALLEQTERKNSTWNALYGEYEYIFLESNFRFTEGNYPTVVMNSKLDSLGNLFEQKGIKGYSEKDLSKGNFNKLNLELESVKLRYRLADGRGGDQSVFRLGAKVLGSGASLDFTKINRAGNAGMQDYFIHWPEGPPKNGQSRKRRLDRGVPSPHLLPHSFAEWRGK